MMDTYAFVLGRQPALATAEILACLDRFVLKQGEYTVLLVNEEFMLLGLPSDIKSIDLFHRLGGYHGQ